jgi:uncharacterized protein YecE (DUF72 family)
VPAHPRHAHQPGPAKQRTPAPKKSSPAEIPSPGTLASAPPHLYLGTSGWAYPTWKPGFYPADVPARRFLDHYATRLTSVEVNYTFGSELKPGQLAGWLAAVPEGFRFTFKAPQRITHFQRLLHSEETLKSFFDSLKPAAKAGKLGAVLFQLPPNFKANPERLAAFLALPALRRKGAPQIAFEFRHESWFSEDIYTILCKHRAALCVAESEDLCTPDITTAPHRYYRLRMPDGYTPAQLKLLAQKFVDLATTETTTFVYFKHEDAPTGALNATATLQLMRRAAEANA